MGASAKPLKLNISGMSCNGCVNNVTQTILGVEGVDRASVDLESATAVVYGNDKVRDEEVIAAVKGKGFDAKVADSNAEQTGKWDDWSPLRGWKFNVVFGGAILLVILLGHWVFGLAQSNGFRWFELLAATLVQVICGSKFYVGAWQQLKSRSSNMDTLVALGSTAAFLLSVWMFFAKSDTHLYFMESVGIITLISVGHWMEALISRRASDALRALMKLAPDQARLVLADGSEREVEVASLSSGDNLLLKPGEAFPVDGVVIEGTAAVDESMLTGESVPVEKRKGDPVYAGTQNVNGALRVEVIKSGEGTALAGIIRVVERAQSSRAEIQKLGDRVSSVFVPIVVVIAIGTGLWWGFAPGSAERVAGFFEPWLWQPMATASLLESAVLHAVAVLIIACPCAMGLATPAAIMAGTNAAARRGILIRDGSALEKSGVIDTVLFDKTGTLTTGEHAVVDSQSFIAGDVETVAASIAARSNHPLSNSIAKLTSERCEIADWREIPGKGLEASLADRQGVWRLGSRDFVRECLSNEDAIAGSDEESGSTLYLSCDENLAARFVLQDTLKTGVRELVDKFQAAGLEVYMVSGDRRKIAETIGGQIGINAAQVLAEVRPEEKAAQVMKLQNEGRKVAFVGDGINDAPALKQADLGIAVSRASDVVKENSDIILLGADIHVVDEALGLARATLRTIKQNLFWAFFYNAAAIPLAALGFLNPMLAAAAMGLSDVLVVGNSFRLRSWKPKL